MFERRPLLGALIGLTLCISVWRISVQEPEMITEIQYVQPSTPHFTQNVLTNETTISSSSSSLFTNSIDMLPKDDYTNLIDLNNFDFLINHRKCSDNHLKNENEDSSNSLRNDNKSPLVLILVHSAPTNWHKRNTIRETWGQYDPRSRLIFLLGAVSSTKLQKRLEQENRLYDDIVQGNFIDAYRNMTYKHVMALKWFTYHCQDAKYILKTDDDVFINSPMMYEVLETSAQRRKLLFCCEVSGARVKRSYRSKWRVSPKEYSGKYYPNHCPGFSIIYTPDVALQLYKEAQKQPYFWIDDVHMTGTVAQKTNVTITPTGNLYLTKSQKNDILNDKLNATGLLFFFTTPDLKESEIRKLWKTVILSNNR